MVKNSDLTIEKFMEEVYMTINLCSTIVKS